MSQSFWVSHRPCLFLRCFVLTFYFCSNPEDLFLAYVYFSTNFNVMTSLSVRNSVDPSRLVEYLTWFCWLLIQVNNWLCQTHYNSQYVERTIVVNVAHEMLWRRKTLAGSCLNIKPVIPGIDIPNIKIRHLYNSSFCTGEGANWYQDRPEICIKPTQSFAVHASSWIICTSANEKKNWTVN